VFSAVSIQTGAKPGIPMSYRDQLHPWCIICLLANQEQSIVRRFRRRGDAEEHLKVLRAMSPMTQYSIIFISPENPLGSDQAVPPDSSNSAFKPLDPSE
jgi:hypothetical protein